MFRPMVGFQANLRSTLEPDAAVLDLYPNDVARIADALTDAGDYTRLWVGDSRRYECVKVTGIVDGAVAIARAQEGTCAIKAGMGTCVSFAWTAQSLADFIHDGMGGITPAVCSVEAGSDRVSVTTNGCAVTVDRPACDGVSWRAGNATLTQDEAGCITSKPLTTQLADGEYVNATVTIKDGEIVAIKSGTNIVYTGGGCCCGNGS